jgi:hypothetical protein
MESCENNARHPKRFIAYQTAWRSGFLNAARWFIPKLPCIGKPKGLACGNRKTGTSGIVYKNVFVWNLPPVATCPGRSDWCLRNCYNADSREDKFPIRDWCENWAWVETRPDILRGIILKQIQQSSPPVGVRIHSSGDFYSSEYIKLWHSIIKALPDTIFWAYTRSWQNPYLFKNLCQLKTLPNLQLFASCDETSSPPPPKWRYCIVTNSLRAAQKYVKAHSCSQICRENTGKVSCCASCGLCGQRSLINIIFRAH